MDIKEIIELGANRLENNHWMAGNFDSIGWLVGVTYVDNPGREYAARKAFGDWFAPDEYRNDGMLISETAAEKGLRIGRAETVKAMREFAAS